MLFGKDLLHCVEGAGADVPVHYADGSQGERSYAALMRRSGQLRPPFFFCVALLKPKFP
jgi:hypothetical protein